MLCKDLRLCQKLINTKRQPKFFIDVSFWKGNRPGRSLLFSKRINKKTFADIWCLVIGFYSLAYPNEKKIWPGCEVNLIKASNDAYALECQHVWWGQAYRTRPIISRGLYTFLPHFQRPFMYCDLWPFVWLVFKSSF